MLYITKVSSDAFNFGCQVRLSMRHENSKERDCLIWMIVVCIGLHCIGGQVRLSKRRENSKDRDCWIGMIAVCIGK